MVDANAVPHVWEHRRWTGLKVHEGHTMVFVVVR
jgi:hypothetical protein